MDATKLTPLMSMIRPCLAPARVANGNATDLGSDDIEPARKRHPRGRVPDLGRRDVHHSLLL